MPSGAPTSAETVATDYLPAITEEAARAGEYGADRLTLKADREILSAKLSELRRIADRRRNVGSRGPAYALSPASR